MAIVYRSLVFNQISAEASERDVERIRGLACKRRILSHIQHSLLNTTLLQALEQWSGLARTRLARQLCWSLPYWSIYLAASSHR